MHEHHHPTDGVGHHMPFDSPEAAAFAEGEAEALVGFATEGASVLADLCRRDGVRVRRVLDVGSGPGVGTCVLAERFGSAVVVAADGSAAMLERVAARADRLGMADRVEARLVELPGGLDEIGRFDIAWASMVLHHVGDQLEALRGIRRSLAPGGLFALVEGSDPLRVLPETVDLGRPGLWERLDRAWASWFSDLRADLTGSGTSPDHPAMMEEAGFELVANRALTLTLDAPLDPPARRFLREHLARTQVQLAHHAGAADLGTLDVLIDDDSHESIMRREDALLRGSRHLYVARA
jgi:SAM-dependent methyltransferase